MSDRKKRKVSKNEAGKLPKVESPKYFCDHCSRDITNLVRIRCAECTGIDLCLACFSVGVEVTNEENVHKNDHSYHVVDKESYPLVEEGWSATEELLLLEAIELYGYGNWADIADHVGTHNKAECQAHYEELYLKGPDGNPDTTNVLSSGTSLQRFGDLNDVSDGERGDTDDKTKAAAGTGGSTKRPRSKKGDVKTTTPAEAAGYYPMRADFDTEYENEAEQTIKDMTFKEVKEDNPVEKEFKLAVLHAYNARLDERAKRKAFVFERHLTDADNGQRYDTRNTAVKKNTEKDYDRFRIFARFHTEGEHKQLLDGLQQEAKIRQRIRTLQEWRKNGISTLTEGDTYDAEKKRRETERQQRKDRDGGSFVYGGGRAGTPSDAPEKAVKGRKLAMPVELRDKPGVTLLSPTERKICASLRVTPFQYLNVKNVLVRESFRRGALAKTDLKQICRLEAGKLTKLYEFFVANGWVVCDATKLGSLLTAAKLGSLMARAAGM